MLVIRFLRTGKKNQPTFKIVVTDKEKPPRAGRFVEQVGFYNPKTKEKVLHQERIKYWISVGAQPSDTVYNLLVAEKIIEGKKRDVHKKPKKEEPASAEEKAAEVSPQPTETEPQPQQAEETKTEEPKTEEEPKEESKEKPAE
jgi:small subunit ribosomal protein S16